MVITGDDDADRGDTRGDVVGIAAADHGGHVGVDGAEGVISMMKMMLMMRIMLSTVLLMVRDLLLTHRGASRWC